MKIKELRELTDEDLKAKFSTNKEELFTLRFNQAAGTLEKPSRIRELRKENAKIKTILRERELQD